MAAIAHTDPADMPLLGNRRDDRSVTDVRSEFSRGWDRIEIHARSMHDTIDGTVRVIDTFVRWRRSPGQLWARGLVMPVAAELGISDLCTDRSDQLALDRWSTSSHRGQGARLLLNLHRTQFVEGRIAGRLAEIMSAMSIRPDEVILSIPARLNDRARRRAARLLRPLTRHGAILALDDHPGTSALQPSTDWLPPGSIVKLDPALTSLRADSRAHDRLLDAVFSLHLDGYDVTATAIDHEPELVAAVEAGVDFVQGDLFGSPTLLT